MQMNLFPKAILAICGIGVGLIVVSELMFHTLLGEVNGRSSPDQQIGMLGVNVKLFLVLRRHAELFPESRKRLQMLALTVAGFVVAIAGLLLGVFHYSAQ